MIHLFPQFKLIKLLVLIAALTTFTGCGFPQPTPGASPSDFSYVVNIQEKDSLKSIVGAQVSIQVGGIVPLYAVTDNQGIAIIPIGASFINQSGVLIVETTNYQKYTLHINLFKDALPTVILLEPLNSSAPTQELTPTEEPVPTPTDKPTPTEEPTKEPTVEPTIEIPTPTSTPTSEPPTSTIEPTITPTPTPAPPSTTSNTLTPEAPSSLAIGSEMVRPKDGAEMVYIPAGQFTMGSDSSNADAQEDEFPAHIIFLGSFWIDKYEVTNVLYKKCVDEGRCKPLYLDTPEYADFNGSNQPVINVDWNDAKTYCQWAGGDLPTEAQWEKAARGTDGSLYPWGDQFNGNEANYCDSSCGQSWGQESPTDDGYELTSPVGQFPAGKSIYGTYDMAGNVWEWVNDWYQGYPNTTYQTNEFGEILKVFRGGSWYDRWGDLHSAYRGKTTPEVKNKNFGFRCIYEESSTSRVLPTSSPDPTDTPLPAPPPSLLISKLAIPLKAGNEFRIYVVEVDSIGKIINSSLVSNARQPLFSHKGQSILALGIGGTLNGVFTIDQNGQSPYRLNERNLAHWPVWSPDDDEIIFADIGLSDGKFLRHSSQGAFADTNFTEVRANTTTLVGRNLIWTKNNQLIFRGCAYWKGPSGAGECGIWYTDADTVNPQRILVTSDYPMDASNSLLAYLSNTDGDWEIYLVPLTGGTFQNLTNNDNNIQDGLAVFSPDGRTVAYVSNESGAWAVWTMSLSNFEKHLWFAIDSGFGTIDLNTWAEERMSWSK